VDRQEARQSSSPSGSSVEAIEFRRRAIAYQGARWGARPEQIDAEYEKEARQTVADWVRKLRKEGRGKALAVAEKRRCQRDWVEREKRQLRRLRPLRRQRFCEVRRRGKSFRDFVAAHPKFRELADQIEQLPADGTLDAVDRLIGWRLLSYKDFSGEGLEVFADAAEKRRRTFFRVRRTGSKPTKANYRKYLLGFCDRRWVQRNHLFIGLEKDFGVNIWQLDSVLPDVQSFEWAKRELWGNKGKTANDQRRRNLLKDKSWAKAMQRIRHEPTIMERRKIASDCLLPQDRQVKHGRLREPYLLRAIEDVQRILRKSKSPRAKLISTTCKVIEAHWRACGFPVQLSYKVVHDQLSYQRRKPSR
jgi:hypothetical protein